MSISDAIFIKTVLQAAVEREFTCDCEMYMHVEERSAGRIHKKIGMLVFR